MELSEQEAHCIARLLQGGWFAKHPIDACAFCKYQCRKDEASRDMSNAIRKRLSDETGVDLGFVSHEFYQKRAVKAPSFSYGDETAQIILVIF